MAVPKRFRFKTKKKKFLHINNNQGYIKPLNNQYFLHIMSYKLCY